MLNVLFKVYSPLTKTIDLVQVAYFAAGETGAGTGVKGIQ